MRGLIAVVGAASTAAAALVVPNTWEGDVPAISRATVNSIPEADAEFHISIPLNEAHQPDLDPSATSSPFTISVSLVPDGPECGSGSIIVNDESVSYAQRKSGETSFTGEYTLSSSIETKWEIICERPLADPYLPANPHSVRFWVDSISGRPVTDIGIEVTYNQYDKRAFIAYRIPFPRHRETIAAYREPISGDEGLNEIQEEYISGEDRFAEMQNELQDLKYQRDQLKALINAKKSEIAEAIRLSYGDSGSGMTHCDSMKCVLQVALYDAKQVVKSAKSSAMSVLSSGGHHHPHWPHWGHHGNGTRGNCTHPPAHGNHTFPPPPHRKPRLPPPGFCHCPPPPDGPPGEDPPHRRPGPPGKPPHGPPPHDGPPHDGPPHDSPPHDGPPDFDHPPPPYEPRPPHHRPPHDSPPDSEQPPLPFERRPHHHRPHYHHHPHPLPPTLFILSILFFLATLAFHLCQRSTRRSSSSDEKPCRRRCRGGCAGRRKRREYEDKDEVLPLHEPVPGYTSRASTDIQGEIRGLRTAAECVVEMVARAAERGERRMRRGSGSTVATLPEYSRVDVKMEGEELPGYVEGDGSEDGAVVVDGFRYRPGVEGAYCPSNGEVWRARVDGEVVDFKP